MIDHLLNFPDEAAAAAALPDYWVSETEVFDEEAFMSAFPPPKESFGTTGAWRGDCCIPGVHVYQVTGTETLTDPTTGEVYERELVAVYPGWFVLIARPELDLLLHELDECCLVRDREAGAILFTAPDVEPPLDGAIISPQFA